MKYYVAMQVDKQDNKLKCLVAFNAFDIKPFKVYGYKTVNECLAFIAKCARFHEVCDMFSVQGQDFNNLETEQDHLNLAQQAEREFNA